MEFTNNIPCMNMKNNHNYLVKSDLIKFQFGEYYLLTRETFV